MTRFLMMVLLIGGTACGVDGGPATSSAPDPSDDPTAATTAPGSSGADDRSPDFVAQCSDGVCETVAACRAAGGRLGPPCAATAVCCRLD